MRRLMILLLVAATIALSGCTLRFIYYWMDIAIVWEVDDYFDLERQQKRLLKAEVQDLIHWHQRSEIPRYHSDMEEFYRAVASPVAPARVEDFMRRFERDVRRIIDNAVPRAVRLADMLRDDQYQRFFAERATHAEKKWYDFNNKPKTAKVTEFATKLRNYLIYWIGDVKPEQELLIQEAALWQYELYPQWLHYQRDWWQQLALIQQLRGTAEYHPQLEKLLRSGDGLMGGRYFGYSQETRTRAILWLSRLSTSLDIKQRAHLYALLKGYAQELDKLEIKE